MSPRASAVGQCMRWRLPALVAGGHASAATARRRVGWGAAEGRRKITAEGVGASYVQYPFEVEPGMAGRRGQKVSNIFAQHNAGSKFVMLNRPEALNALNTDMIRDLDRLYEFCLDQITVANSSRTPEGVEHALHILRTLEEGWDAVIPG